MKSLAHEINPIVAVRQRGSVPRGILKGHESRPDGFIQFIPAQRSLDRIADSRMKQFFRECHCFPQLLEILSIGDNLTCLRQNSPAISAVHARRRLDKAFALKPISGTAEDGFYLTLLVGRVWACRSRSEARTDRDLRDRFRNEPCPLKLASRQPQQDRSKFLNGRGQEIVALGMKE